MVDDVAHVRLVDPHAERIGGHHDESVVIDEILLRTRSFLDGKPRMVAYGGEARIAQGLVNLLHVLTRRTVDDARIPIVIAHVGKDAHELALPRQLLDVEMKVRAIEARGDPHRIMKAEQAGDVVAHLCGRRGGERDHHRTMGQLPDEIADPQIRRPEILAPLRYAMGPVHRKKGDMRLRCEGDEARIAQTLGSHVHHVVGARKRTAHHGRLLPRRQRRVEVRTAYAGVEQRAHLVAHQGNERGNDQREAFHDHGRDLIADGFPGARGHHADAIAPRQYGAHQIFLTRSKRRITEMTLKRRTRFVHQAGIRRRFLHTRRTLPSH